MNATITKTPPTNSRACRICAPVSSSPNRIASAQPPAKAPPRHFGANQEAALSDGDDAGQAISRGAGAGEGCVFMKAGPVSPAISMKRPGLSSAKGPKKPASRDIAAFRVSCMSRLAA